ncbi:MAG: ABC transporter substrate-binding protein [Flavobacteriaceae bacterium]|nr:ABC transporter substrate-binding protein [Flavobacteriaceae bacterium]
MRIIKNKKQHWFLLGFTLLVALCFGACESSKQEKFDLKTLAQKEVKYASTFSLYEGEGFQVIEVKEPWPKAEKSLIYVVGEDPSLVPENLEHQHFIQLPIEKMVVTSTTHIPSLESLNELNKLIGFPNLDYISSKGARKLINEGKIKELRQNESLNTEVLISLKTDLVVGFAVEGSNKSLNTLEKMGVPVLYNSDWLERNPLGKAEWIKVFGILTEKEAEASEIFNEIESTYLATKKMAQESVYEPEVISGAMHNDRWYLPYGDSWQGQLLSDANANYIYDYTHGSGSIALAFEKVLEKGQSADFWIGPAQYTSLEQLLESNSHYQKFEAFQNKKVYGTAMITGETGGVIYYELGPNRPDLVLKDLVKILHPELLEEYQLNFFKALK